MRTGLRYFFLLLPGFAAAQSTTIRGRIFTEDNKPAPYITVVLQHLKYATETTKDGVFVLNNLPALHDTLVVSGVGFVTYYKPVAASVSAIFDADDIYLKYAVNELQNIEITGRIKSSYKSDYSFAATKTQTPLVEIPQTVSTVTKELINDKLEQHLNSALDNVSGVTRYSGYEEYTIRGMRAENPHLINGLRIFNTKLTSPMLINVERVEVLKGPSSILYGNQDPGGTINIVTKKPLSENKYFIAAGAGSWNAYNIQGDATGPLSKSKEWLYRLNAGYENTNSFRNNVFLRSFQVAPSLSFIPNDKLQLNLDVAYTHVNSVADRGQPSFEDDKNFTSTPISLSVIQPGDYLKETNFSTELSGTYNFNKHFSFTTGYINYITKQSLSEHGFKDFITNDSINLYYAYRQVNTTTNTFTNYATAKFNTGAVQHQLLAGFDLILADLSATQYNGELPGTQDGEGNAGTFSLAHPNYFMRPVSTYKHVDPPDEGDDDDDGEYQTHGFYVQEELNWKKWFLQTAFRAEFYTSGDAADGEDVTKETKLMPSVGLTYAATNNLHVYGVYKEGFDPFEASTLVEYFDTTFKPITSHMVEFGGKAELFNKQLFASLSCYQIIINNVAVNANDPDNPNLFVQRGQQCSRGFEAEAEGNLFSHLNVSVGYAYNLTKISKSVKPEEVGTIAENAPRNSSNSWLKYNFSNGFLNHVAVAVGHNQASKRNTLVAGTTLPGYTILNCGLYYAYKHFLLSGVLNNITNKKYYASAYNSISKWPGAPRNFMLRVGYSF